MAIFRLKTLSFFLFLGLGGCANQNKPILLAEDSVESPYAQRKPLVHNSSAYSEDSYRDTHIFTKATSDIRYIKVSTNIPYGADDGIVKIEYNNFSIDIYLINTEAYLSMSVNGLALEDKTEINFNYFYDIDLESALERITWFVDNNNNHILMLPSFTEEYPTYNLLSIDKTGLSSSYIIEIKDWACRDIEQLTLDKLSRPIKAKTNLGATCQTHIIDNPSIQ